MERNSFGQGCSSAPALPSRIKRVFYMSSEGGKSLHEVNTSCTLFSSTNNCHHEKLFLYLGHMFFGWYNVKVALNLWYDFHMQEPDKVKKMKSKIERRYSGIGTLIISVISYNTIIMQSFETSLTCKIQQSALTQISCLDS